MSRSKIILRTFTTILVVMVVLLAFSVSLIRLFGFEVYGVLTGSMEPKYPVGSLIYVKEINTDKLEVGDAISFKLSENVIATHRIVEIVPSETVPGSMSYRTKGDANDVEDSSLVEEADIIGKVVFCLPKMGYILEYIQSPSGIVTTIIVSLVLIVLVFVSELITSDSEMLWRIRCAITGETGSRSTNHRSGKPQQRRSPQYEDQPRRRPQRYEDDYAPRQRSRSQRYEDDYYEAPSRGSRYDDYSSSSRSSRSASSRGYEDYGETRRSSRSASSGRYDDYGSSSRSSRSASSRGYEDYGETRRSSRNASSGRYDDYGSSSRSSRSASSRGYEDYGETRRSSRSASSGRYDDYGSSSRSSRSASSRGYEDYGETRRSSRSASSGRYDDYGASSRSSHTSSSSRGANDGYTTRRSR